MNRQATGPLIDRRRLFQRLGEAVAGVFLVGTVSCASEEPEPERQVRLPVERLDADGRAVLRRPDLQVEFLRVDGGFVARSLLCTHFGCFVEWKPEQRRYLCPCHDGVFEADGSVLYGPPQRPLLELPVRREGDVLVADISALEPAEPESSR